MARLPRLALADHAHLVLLRAHGGSPAVADDADRVAFRAALREAASAARTAVHGYSVTETAATLLLRPATAAGLSRTMQALGRRYVSAYNRRHGRRGTLWDGRFRCALVEPGAWTLAALMLVDGDPGGIGAAPRTGGSVDALLVDPAEYWRLGNTPFEREHAYRQLLAIGVSAHQRVALVDAAVGGWVAGETAFRDVVAGLAARPTLPRKPGRPARPTVVATCRRR